MSGRKWYGKQPEIQPWPSKGQSEVSETKPSQPVSQTPDPPSHPQHRVYIDALTAENAQLRAESAAKDEVIRRLLDGWFPSWVNDEHKWVSSTPSGWVSEPMSDAHRAVLENLP